MKLLIGLGNPGPKYETTRHNAGFLVVDELAAEFGIDWQGQKFNGDFAKGTLFGEQCLLLKPQTFMNLSGRSVAKAMGFFKLSHKDIIVVHDDIDLTPGKVKSRAGGGHGGHNGIRSIIAETGSSDFFRLKLGIGRPLKPQDGQVTNWVLGSFTDEELLVIQNDMLQDVKLRLEPFFKQSS